jgi:hypothetical protein
MPEIGKPEAGFYRLKLVRNGPWCPVKIWYGPPADPEDPTHLLDRSWRWQATVDGAEADVWDVWPAVGGRAIDEAEYRYLVNVSRHAKLHDPAYPEATPDKPINLLTVKIPF